MKRTAIVAGVGRRSGFGIALVSTLAARGYSVVATTRTAEEADALRAELPIDAADACLDPDALAAVYVDLIEQPPSCWTHELDVRPFAEGF